MFNSSIFGNRTGLNTVRSPYTQLSGGGHGGHGGGGHGGGHHGGGGGFRRGGGRGYGYGYGYGPTYFVDEGCPPGTVTLEDGTCVLLNERI